VRTTPGAAADHSDFQRRTRWGETMILKHDGDIAEIGYENGDELMHGRDGVEVAGAAQNS
jgi:hypothetical protein